MLWEPWFSFGTKGVIKMDPHMGRKIVFNQMTENILIIFAKKNFF